MAHRCLAPLLIAALPALAGCGFTPLYATSPGMAGPGTSLALVNVALIPDRNGQELRQDLQDRLERGGNSTSSRYDLFVNAYIAGGDIALDQQSASTRSRQVGYANWTLKAQNAGHTTLATGSAKSLDGFNVINQQFFASDLSREAAARRINEALADQITQGLAVYFKQHPAS